MSIFKEMKKTKEWEQWDTQFRADVTTQGLSNILDPNYIPATYDDKMLFREQQHYMYAVFVRVLKMDKGKAIVRKYKGTYDAQSIYRELQEYASKSTQAVIDANTLLQYITTASLSDGSWNGTTEQFVLHWLEQVRLYEELVDASAALSDSVKLTLLTNAVRGHTKLSSVHNVAIQLASHFGHAVDFTKYSELLLSECAQVDSALAHSSRKSGKRSVYFTDLTMMSQMWKLPALQRMKLRHCMHSLPVVEMMPHRLTSAMYCPQAQSALQTSPVKPTHTSPTVWANTELTSPVPSLIAVRMVE